MSEQPDLHQWLLAIQNFSKKISFTKLKGKIQFVKKGKCIVAIKKGL